jgi:hypothetical protein
MADSIPHAVLSEQLQERIGGRRIVAAVFLSFQFDPGFFEQEILPVLLDVPLSHARLVRLIQLDDSLRACAGKVAVYYDTNALFDGGAGSAKLDVRRIPMRVLTGVFHPKNIFLLLEEPEKDDEGHRARSLLVGAMSANLTRAGWWENVEACHFEEIAENEYTRLKDDLLDLLRDLRRHAPGGIEHEAVEEVIGFLRTTDQRVNRVTGDRLLPHFYSDRESFPDFLERVAGQRIRGSYLEIISPFLDNAANCKPLKELIERFEPKEVRVLLPRARSGEAACRKDLYDSVHKMSQTMNVHWGKLTGALLAGGKTESASERFIHAKVYRFFTQKPKQEICFIGSANLTNAAHQRGGNWETGLLVEVDCPQMPDFWLTLEEKRPENFRNQSEADTSSSGGSPLVLRYSWSRKVAEAFWDADQTSPSLSLMARGVLLGNIRPLHQKQWTPLGDDFSRQLAKLLVETSFVEVHGFAKMPVLLLVLEEGMSQKPSLLQTLSAADILRYWTILTPAQRSAFIEARTPELALCPEGSDLVARIKIKLDEETFFDRFAGFFHSFGCLDREVRVQLSEGRDAETAYRVFGKKYDSLGTLIDRVLSDDGMKDDVDRYVVLLCARQLLQEIKGEFPEFWKAHRDDANDLNGALVKSQEVRKRLIAKDPKEMTTFLDWFDRWFIKRAAPVEVQS